MIQLDGNKTVSAIQIGGTDGLPRNTKEVYVGNAENLPVLVWSSAPEIIYLTESQTWTIPAGVKKIDVFLVGGGAAGSKANAYVWQQIDGVNYSRSPTYGGGGGGGYTLTVTDIAVTPGQIFNVTIGIGGIGRNTTGQGAAGGDTSLGDYTAKGGNSDHTIGNYMSESTHSISTYRLGTPGGSSGGEGYVQGVDESGTLGNTDGESTEGYNQGQGTTTREFGQEDGKLYASGGDGGLLNMTYPAKSGAENTGDGGQGIPNNAATSDYSGNGGSGIVVIKCYK